MNSTSEHDHGQEDQQYVVLYVEDNSANLRLVAQALSRRKNIQLLSAHTPELGLELASSKQPDLILLDINMPGMSGYEVKRRLDENHVTCNIPVVAISANSTERDIRKGMLAGFKNYLTKPFEIDDFYKIIDSHLCA